MALGNKNWIQTNRRLLLISVPLLILIIALAYYAFTGRYVSTDNAYVLAAKATISSNVPGQVVKINVKDNQFVHKGDNLFELDSQPYKIAVMNAQANLARTKLKIAAMKATYKQKVADLGAAAHNLEYLRQEYERQKKLASIGISSKMQLNQATNNYNLALQQYASSEQQRENIKASLANDENIPVEQHPAIQQAQAELDKAKLNLSYTVIKAPMDGIVAKVEQVQLGDYINAGTPVFALLSTNDIWIEANFKETEMTYMRPGQSARIIIDIHTEKTLKGHVASMSPGTGSSFSLLPPENATGNWVKVVQRVPVRIAIDENMDRHYLKAGLSADVTIDTGATRFTRWFRKRPRT